MTATRRSCALAAFKKYLEVESVCRRSSTLKDTQERLSTPSKRRRLDSLNDQAFDLEVEAPQAVPLLGQSSHYPETILYLAYGSNLSAETFQGNRGIRPLSQVNVVVPELVMTFDLAGLPYLEPCFANTKYRKLPQPPITAIEQRLPHPDLFQDFKSLVSPNLDDHYHKTRWKKGLVGVVYEVTKEDYAHIIATEGGGAGYQDVLVECHELSLGENIVPQYPASAPFKVHTLYAPSIPPGDRPPEQGEHFSRPDPNYAQASARYLKLITDGADEHALPAEYKNYLHQLRPYTITTEQQKLGSWIFMMIWVPFVRFVFGLNNRFADEDGKAPRWLVLLTSAIFSAMWMSYDGFFYGIFGDGERTIYQKRDARTCDMDREGKVMRSRWSPERDRVLNEKVAYSDDAV